jgi:hypothetical protein
MSIIHTLKKLVDPIAAREEDARLKKTREARRQQQSGDPPTGSSADGAEPARFRCRCCETEDTQGVYCPQCLADTMEPVPRSPETDG